MSSTSPGAEDRYSQSDGPPNPNADEPLARGCEPCLPEVVTGKGEMPCAGGLGFDCVAKCSVIGGENPGIGGSGRDEVGLVCSKGVVLGEV